MNPDVSVDLVEAWRELISAHVELIGRIEHYPFEQLNSLNITNKIKTGIDSAYYIGLATVGVATLAAGMGISFLTGGTEISRRGGKTTLEALDSL
jgi:hypothetical protein